MMDAQHERANGHVVPTAKLLHQQAHTFTGLVFTFVMMLKQLVQDLRSQRRGLLLVQHAYGGINSELMGVPADDLQAKAMKRADVSGIEQQKLLANVIRSRGTTLRLLQYSQFFADALSHFCGRGISESDHQDFIQPALLLKKETHAAVDERARLARACASYHQHVP